MLYLLGVVAFQEKRVGRNAEIFPPEFFLKNSGKVIIKNAYASDAILRDTTTGPFAKKNKQESCNLLVT
jgi:hypothetical protein